jgi:adenine-specific DNA-methyltransferase
MQDWMEELRATGILGRNKKKIEFSRVEPLEGGTFLHAVAETAPQSIVKGNLIDDPTTLQQTQRAVICFAGENYPLDVRMVEHAMNEARYIQPRPELLIFAAFQFDPAAAEVIDSMNWPNLTLLKAQMNTDLMTGDLKKNRSSNQSFWLVGQPDVELVKITKGEDKGKYMVKLRGFDYYDVTKGQIDSGGTNRVALWMLDTDYDGMCVEPRQVFFPMDGSSGGWERLAKTLKAEIDQDLIEKYRGVESLPFAVKDNTSIAIKIVDDRGIESLKVMSVGRAE